VRQVGIRFLLQLAEIKAGAEMTALAAKHDQPRAVGDGLVERQVKSINNIAGERIAFLRAIERKMRDVAALGVSDH
jgi:NADH/NAD ratio-sensing transcriptional regulator Rex